MQVLAYYLPQFHPIPENDNWWGPGFTEWTNVRKAKPLFANHKQPNVPGELGYYSLLDSHTRRAQARLALDHGIDGFIYYSYWFGNGNMLLEKPAELMLADPETPIPFCFCWANESWKGIMHGIPPYDTLIEQTYPGIHDYRAYFEYLLPYFRDERYIKIDGQPMFHIYRFTDLPDPNQFTTLFTQWAQDHGFPGIYFVATGHTTHPMIDENPHVRAVAGNELFKELRRQVFQKYPKGSLRDRIYRWLQTRKGNSEKLELRRSPLMLDYSQGIRAITSRYHNTKYIPVIVSNWDNSPRSGVHSMILTNCTPDTFRECLQEWVNEHQKHPLNPPFLVIKSWNEWAEGNYLEPDAQYGRAWLEAVKKVKSSIKEPQSHQPKAVPMAP
jgi:hypothetical protein